MLNGNDVLKVLENLPVDSIVFVSYIPGRKPHAKAFEAGERAVVDEGISPRHFTGKFKGVRRTAKLQEVVFTLWVEERDSVHRDGTKTVGAFRAFNPSLGKLLTLTVVHKAS